jgi:predicted nucleic acid-binding protein
MRKARIYLETTVFNYYFDADRDGHNDTKRLFEEIKAGKYEAYTAIYVIDELMKADEPKRSDMIALIADCNITVIPADDVAESLADIYVKEGIIPESKQFDAFHIAIATVNDLDYIFSFNFQHINRLKTKEMTSIINLRQRYKPVTIAIPSEVVEYDDDEQMRSRG